MQTGKRLPTALCKPARGCRWGVVLFQKRCSASGVWRTHTPADGGDGQAVLTLLLGFVELVVDAAGADSEKLGRAQLIAVGSMQRGFEQ